MNEYFKKIAKQIGDFYKQLSPIKKMAMFATAAAILVGCSALFFWAGHQAYTPLMSNLGAEDAANIIRILREKHIPFKVDPSGKNVSIPAESIYELRLELATMGLPQSGAVGYELFDKQSLGTTSFVQKINQKRALEGELMRTVATIKGVRRSRVHLAIPQKSAFVEDQKKPSASVVVDLDPGTQLAEKQVYGIGNLVARAVEGLEVQDVVIMDSNGKVLSKNSGDPLSSATATQLEYQQKVEQDLEKRVESILSRVVGEGRVAAKVTAELDFSQVNETQTLFDADGLAVRSVEKRNDTMAGTRPGPYGVAGAASNTPGQPPAANNETKYDTAKSNEVTNYEIPQTVRRVTKAAGAIKKISVAVVVDGKLTKTADKDGKMLSKVDPWAPEKLKEFEDIVASSLGIDKKRGDVLDVKNMEFSREDFEEAQRLISDQERRSYIQNVIVYAVIGLIIFLFFMFVVRPFIKWVTENTIDSVDTFLPQTIEELERMQKNSAVAELENSIPDLPDGLDPEKVEGEMIRDKVVRLIDSNPHKAALILKDWLHVDPSKKKDAEVGSKNKTA